MREKDNDAKLQAGIDFDISGPELNENQRNIYRSKEDDMQSILIGNDNDNMGEVIRKWESIRFMI